METEYNHPIPRRYRLLFALALMVAALLWASQSVLILCDMIGMCSADQRPQQGITLKPFVNPSYPDHFPWVDYRITNEPYLRLLLAMGMFGLGLLLVPDLPKRKAASLSLKAEAALLGVILLVATFMRFYLGNDFPYGLHFDESTNAMIARDFIEEWKPENQARIAELEKQIDDLDAEIEAKKDQLAVEPDAGQKQSIQDQINRQKSDQTNIRRQIESIEAPVFTPQGFGKATMHMYQIALAMKWFGTSIFSIRFPTMLAGVIGVLALYALMRLLVDAPTALLSAAFLAAFRWHVNFSRVAYDAIEAPAIITITAFFFFLAFKHRDETAPTREDPTAGAKTGWLWHILKTAPYWLLAGYSFGMSIYSYKPLYLFPGILMGFLGIRWLMQRQLLRWNLVGFALFAVAAFWCAKEMLDFRRDHPEVFSERLNMVSIVNLDEPWRSNWNRIYENLEVSYRMFHVRGDINPRHNYPYAPMVHPILGVLFPLGLAWAVVRWRSRLGLFSLGWFTAMMLPMVLSIEAPNTLRAICIIPVVSFWAAIVLRQVGIAFLTLAEDWLPSMNWLRETLRWTGWALSALIIGFYWWGEGRLFFHDQLPQKDPYVHFDAKFVDMAKFVNTQKGNYYCVSDANGHNSLKLLNKEGTWRNHLFLQQELPAHGPADLDAIYIVMEPRSRPDKMVWLDWLYNPDVTGNIAKDPFGEEIFRWYRVPADIKLKHRGFAAEIEGKNGNEPYKANVLLPNLTFNPGEMSMFPPFTIEARAMWVIPEGREGIYRFKVETPDRVQLKIDSMVILDASPGGPPVEVQKDLFAGAHQVEVLFASQDFKGLTQILHQPPGAGDWQPLEGEQFHDRGLLPNGLRMKFWHGVRKWEGKPDYIWVDPIINYRWNPPYKFPMSVEWKGYLNCPTAGEYGIGFEAWDYALVEVDGNKVIESPSQREQRNRYMQATIPLTEGKHAIRVTYSDNVGGGEALRVYWSLPGNQPRQIIPASALTYDY